MPNIVNVVVTQQVASAPSTLQRTGAFISQGGTTLSPNTYQLITRVADLLAILTPSVSITSLAWSTGVVTVTTTTPHGIPSGDTVTVVIAGASPTGYNGSFQGTSTGTSTLTYPLVTDPGSETVAGTLEIGSATELVAMATTFFAQSANLGVYVLELGVGTVDQGVTDLTTYIEEQTTQKFYSYLVPTEWDGNASAVTLYMQYEGTTAQTYFYVSTNLGNYSSYENIKSVFAVLPSPLAPSLEFSTAAFFHATLNYDPGPANLASPLEYTYLYAVTPYSALTNTQQTELLAAGANWVGTGAQGGISNTLIEGGSFMDKNPFNYWYCVDWLSINITLALSAAIINGSNTPTNPLYYNQNGINSLQKVAQATVNNGIAFGLILSPASVNAVPFITYVNEHPGDYAIGVYNGLSCTFVPLRGFSSITIYLTASNIPV